MTSGNLTVKTASGSESFELREDKPLFAGRTLECDLYLPSPAVSRKHAVFLARGGTCGLKDLGSSNGTFLNGKRINKSVRLKDGDIIQIGAFVINFRKTERQSDARDAGRPAPEKNNVASAQTPTDFAHPEPTSVSPEPRTEPSRKAKPAAFAVETPDIFENTDEPTVPASDAAMTENPAAEPPTGSGDDGKQPGRATETGEAPRIGPVPEKSARSSTFPIPIKPPTPVVEKLELEEDSIGDGNDDSAFLIEDDENNETAPDPDLALSKKAAEAGLVGEFIPEVDSEGPGGGNDAPARGSFPSAPPMAMPAPKQSPENPNAIPLDGAFRTAIETRLFLYSFLSDLRRERGDFLARNPGMADAVKSELARQDREIDRIPPPEKAEDMIAKRRAKQRELMGRIKAAKEAGETPPPKPSREMREAEEMAISQWMLCAQSAREALPAAYDEGYKLMRDEPLAKVLADAKIDAVPLLGGGAYHLALEALLEEVKFDRSEIRARLAAMPAQEERKSGAGGAMFGLFGKGRDDDGDDDGDDDEESGEAGESYEELAGAEAQLAERAVWIAQELAFLEKSLIQTFWKTYVEVALAYLPDHENMPFGARAFLRHGAIGFKPWWMPEAVRRHITDDCGNVVQHVRPARDNTVILYADEYLSAVMNWETTPAMDENLELNERNSPNWKADKALRKLICSRSQSVLMRELCETLNVRIDGLQNEAAAADQGLARLVKGQKNYKQLKSELAMRRQSLKVETTKLTNLKNKIQSETLAALEETITETNQRFDSGELPRPDRDFMIRRECEAVRKIGRLLANLKERFMPLALRDSFLVDTDACNDRDSIRGEICEMERRDPALFLETVVPSKKKANRVDLRISPVIVLVPAAGVLAFSWNPRQKPEDGKLGIPTCFIRRRIRERQLTYLLADFRWDTSKAAAGMDVMTSDTIVAAFMTVRWDWRKRSKEGREKGLIFTEQNDRTNWRRVYEAYSQSAYDAGKKLFQRNYDFYERIIGKYFDLPDGVRLLRK